MIIRAVPELTPRGLESVARAAPGLPTVLDVDNTQGRQAARVDYARAGNEIVGAFVQVSPSQIQVRLGFNPARAGIAFDGLSFGVRLRDSAGLLLGERTWPNPGQAYIRSSADQAYIEAVAFKGIVSDAQYTLQVFATDSGEDYSTETRFTAPRPVRPYLSWTWLDGRWTPPVPFPDDGLDYVWDEPTQGWVLA